MCFQKEDVRYTSQPPPSYAEIVNDKAGDSTEYETCNVVKAATVSSSSRYLDVASTRDNIDGSEASTHDNQVNTNVRN